MRSIRSTLMTAAAVAGAAIGGGAIASAATSTTASTASSTTPGLANHAPPAFNPSRGGHTFNGKTETLLSGDVAAKVRAAAVAKVSGTVERVETNVDDSAPYEAHIVKSDGTQVIVEVNSDYSVASVKTMGAHH
jgi:uncharacterized secreted protein with C-terminal beta-propeller domain